MSRFTSPLRSLALFSLIVGWGKPALGDKEAAHTVFRNAQVYALNKSLPWAQAVAVKDGTTVAVGGEDTVAASIGPETRVRDLGEKFVMIGIHDAHLHMELGVDLQFTLRLDA